MVDQQYIEEAVILDTILKDVYSVHGKYDSWTWILDASKSFTVSSCFKHLAYGCSVSTANDDLNFDFMELWKTTIPSKVLIFCSRILTNSLSTRDMLFKRHVINSLDKVGCLFCRKNREDICICSLIGILP